MESLPVTMVYHIEDEFCAFVVVQGETKVIRDYTLHGLREKLKMYEKKDL